MISIIAKNQTSDQNVMGSNPTACVNEKDYRLEY